MNILLRFLNLLEQNASFCLQSPNFCAMGGVEMTCFIPLSELQSRQSVT